MLQKRRCRELHNGLRRLNLSYARSRDEVREAQRLRHAVFVDEMGARLQSLEPGVDADRFDPFCEHLLVRDTASGDVVGTYRVLPPEGAAAAGGCYSAQEFDLARLAHLAPRMAEVGRSCIHPNYRNGAVISLLWSGLADYMRARRLDYLFGCASIGMADGGHLARAVYETVVATHLAPLEYRVVPRCRLPLEELAPRIRVEIPPLIRGYLRVGAYVCGEPAWDPDFNTADLFVLLPVARANARYLRHCLR